MEAKSFPTKELRQIGVVIQFEEAVKGFVRTFKHKASTSALTQSSALSLLSCYRKLMGGWEPLRLIANLPFIDDSSNCSLSLPDPSRITRSSALSLLQCIKFLLNDRFGKLPEELVKKASVKWLKTHAGYRSPNECLFFENSMELEPCDGPFIDEEYYGSELKSYKEELVAIGVSHDQAKARQLLASHICFADSDAITRIYRFLSKSEWKPEKGASLDRIWIPDGEKWVDVSSCVLYDKDKVFGSKLNVLEKHYDSEKDRDLFGFFSSAFGVRTNPSTEDYCALWKDWGTTKDRLSNEECCAFWRFVTQHGNNHGLDFLSKSVSRLPVNAPDSSKNGGILLSNMSDVFIADDLLLKDLFKGSPVFVWYPTPSIKTLPQTKLMEIYRKIGVKEISKCVEMAEAELTDGFKIEQQENNLISLGLVRLILGFLSDPSLKIEAEERSRIIHGLVSLKVQETSEAISTEYTLKLLSKGEKLIAKAKQMIRWEREGVVYAEKMEKACGKRKVLEYATCFGDVIAKGVLWEREDLIGRLSELVKMACLVEFDEDALEFLMKSKNLQVFEEDEKLISDAFSLNLISRLMPSIFKELYVQSRTRLYAFYFVAHRFVYGSSIARTVKFSITGSDFCHGTCDGLVCIYCVNPATRWQRTFPLSTVHGLFSDMYKRKEFHYSSPKPRFGKDMITCTFKPVWLYNSSDFRLDNVTTCEVFDFSPNAWRYVVPASPYRINAYHKPVYLDGSLYWFTECE
ncbi:unnamed protein product [Arabis nemorensis]|uniref:F-box associated beta-propeller type 1 domain-containing protein n=1 Tax=Arabis nemorensis TaxID=586526 RepID=A0A565BUE6_9BRAS|nr:unnamed protein product [Arabis nemorensis]